MAKTHNPHARLPHLDGVRGLAALVVLVSHAARFEMLPQALAGAWEQMGVALFYLLSGYLMAHLYLTRAWTGDEARRFLRNRAARVLPMFYLAVLFGLVTWQLFGAWLFNFTSWGGVFSNLLLWRGTGILWSVPVEIHFYLFFLILWYLRARTNTVAFRHGLMALLAFWLVGVALYSALVLQADHNITPLWMQFFLCGVLLSILEPHLQHAVNQRPRLFDALALGVLLLIPVSLPEVRRDLGWPVLRSFIDPISAGYPAVFFLCALSRVRLFRFLDLGVLRYLGRISFGLYLFHWPVVIIITRLSEDIAIPPTGQFLLVLTTSLFIAGALHVVYERPMQRLLRAPSAVRTGPEPAP